MNEEKKTKEELDSIERLEEELYDRDKPSILHEERFKFKEKEGALNESWSSLNSGKEIGNSEVARSRSTLLKKVFIFASVFFVVAVSVAAFTFFFGFNRISSENVDIRVIGPTAIEAGREFDFEVNLTNNNRVALDDIVITIEYPEGSRDPLDIQKPLTREERRIELIGVKESSKESFKSVMYGERNSIKDLKILVEYQTKLSLNRFVKEKIHQVGIRSSPVTVSVLAAEEVSSGQEIEFKVTVVSNLTSTLDDLVLQIDYPFGFSFEGATPESSFDNNVWLVGTLKPRERKEFIIKGVLEGAEKEEKTFRVAVGIGDPFDEKSIGVEFVSSLETIALRSPFINLDASISGAPLGEYSLKAGSEAGMVINWANDLSSDLNDATLEVKLTGRSLEKTSVRPGQGGSYKSLTDTIVWNKNTTPTLSLIRPKQSGVINFSFETLKLSPDSVHLFRNSSIGVDVLMRGTRFAEGRPPETVSSAISRQIKIETETELSSRALYSIGPFSNTGVIPPKAENPTTYTIVWSVTNAFNDIEDAAITAVLPFHVEWTGNISPQNSEIIFNPVTRTVAWNAGVISAGAGFFLPAKEVAFQVSLTPSLNQVGSTVNLLENTSFIGTDTFTGTEISKNAPILTTNIITDPLSRSRSGIGRVVQ